MRVSKQYTTPRIKMNVFNEDDFTPEQLAELAAFARQLPLGATTTRCYAKLAKSGPSGDSGASGPTRIIDPRNEEGQGREG